MVNIKFNTLIALCLIFNQANISAAKTADPMPEIFLGMDATETSETTETTPQPAPEPINIPLNHESITICGESQDVRYDRYYDYENQEVVVIRTIIEHEYRPFLEDISQQSFDSAKLISTPSEINTEPSQQNTTSDNDKTNSLNKNNPKKKNNNHMIT